MPFETRTARRMSRLAARAAIVFVGATTALLVGAAQFAPGWAPGGALPPLAPEPERTRSHPSGCEVIEAPVVVPDTGATARLVRPRGVGGRVPGVVLVHGAGGATAAGLLAEARVLAANGVAALVYDKRSSGYSALDRDYEALADDAIAAASILTHSEHVDPARVGIAGWSEGGWVAPLAIQREPGLFAFLLLASAPIVSPLEQVAWSIDNVLGQAPHWVRRVPPVALVAGRPFARYLDFDSRDSLSSVDVPVYAAWGADDATLPVVVAVRSLAGAVDAPVTARIIADAGHGLPLRTGWLADAAEWIVAAGSKGSPDGERITGAQPSFALGLSRLPRPVWFTDPRLHVLVAAAAGTASVLLPVRNRDRKVSHVSR